MRHWSIVLHGGSPRPAAPARRFRRIRRPADFSSRQRQLVAHILADGLLSVADCVETRLGVRSVQRRQRKCRGDFLLDAASRFPTPLRSRSSATVASSSDRSIRARPPAARRRRDCDKPKWATVVLNTRLRRLFVPIFVRLSAGAVPASLSDSGSIRSSVSGSPSVDLTMNDLLIVVAEIETVFQERRENRADTRMTALAQPLDNRFLVRNTPPRATRRASTRKARRSEIGRGLEERSKGRAAAGTATARPTESEIMNYL